MDIEERFWAKVDKNGPVVVEELGPCWIWTGSKRTGYGMIRESGQGPMRSAHRLSWAWDNGVEYPDRRVAVRHKCDNPPCVRPEHLEVGTCLENNHDTLRRDRGFSSMTNQLVASARGRARSGESLHDIIKDMPEGTDVYRLAAAVRGETFPYAEAEPVPNPSYEKRIYQKLSDREYQEIVDELNSRSYHGQGRALAKKYGVHPSLITAIKKDKLKTIRRASFE